MASTSHPCQRRPVCRMLLLLAGVMGMSSGFMLGPVGWASIVRKLIIPRQVVLASRGVTSPSGSHTTRHAAAALSSPLDFKPAVDVYARFPEQKKSVQFPRMPTTPVSVTLSLTGAAPNAVDPFALVKNDLSPFSDSIKELVETQNPVLSSAAKHFFEKRHGKRFRPTIVLLMARAVGALDAGVYKREGQLAQITEMIHVASLIHDDVLDEADTRRGDLAIHKLYNNKVAVLAGDYLLARASVLLARLENVQVVEIMANALDALVQGEIMQAKSNPEDLVDLSHYLRKSYYKTASLICNSCCSAALIGGHPYGSAVTVAAEQYGYHLGLAYQIIDDILDFTGTSESLGKPAMADISLGLATAPILYAAETVPELRPIIKRRFKEPGDVDTTYRQVLRTDGVERSYKLAQFHAQSAVDAISTLPPSEARDGLIQLAHMVLTRKS